MNRKRNVVGAALIAALIAANLIVLTARQSAARPAGSGAGEKPFQIVARVGTNSPAFFSVPSGYRLVIDHIGTWGSTGFDYPGDQLVDDFIVFRYQGQETTQSIPAGAPTYSANGVLQYSYNEMTKLYVSQGTTAAIDLITTQDDPEAESNVTITGHLEPV